MSLLSIYKEIFYPYNRMTLIKFAHMIKNLKSQICMPSHKGTNSEELKIAFYNFRPSCTNITSPRCIKWRENQLPCSMHNLSFLQRATICVMNSAKMDHLRKKRWKKQTNWNRQHKHVVAPTICIIPDILNM